MSASFSSPFSILKDIEELDEVGEDIIAEISEDRSEEHTSELQSRPHISYAVFCLKKKKKKDTEFTHIYYINNS